MPGLPPDLVLFLNRWPRRLAALACLLLAGASLLSARRPPVAAPVPQPSGAGAAREIPAGSTLVAADVTISHWPRSLVPAGTVPDSHQLVGHRSAAAIGRGEAITTGRLVGADLAAGLPAGQLAVPVSLADPNAAALIRAGDRVDLVVTTDGEAERAGGPADPAVAVAVAVRVLAVLPPSKDAETTAGTTLIVATDRATALRIATLAARPMLAVRDDHP